MDKRPIIMWGVAHWSKGLYADTIRRTRKEAIEAFVSQFVPRGSSWKSESEFGVHKAMRVQSQIWDGH